MRRTLDSLDLQESCRLLQLLTSEELGDRQPPPQLRRMRRQLGDEPSEANRNLLRELFVQRFPANMRTILAVAANMPIDKLAELADSITEHAILGVSSVTGTLSSTAGNTLEQTIEQLTETINTLQTHRPQSSRRRFHRESSHGRHSPLRARPPSRKSSPSLEEKKATTCWYHHRFVAYGRRCHSPCNWEVICFRQRQVAACECGQHKSTSFSAKIVYLDAALSAIRTPGSASYRHPLPNVDSGDSVPLCTQ